MLFAVLQQGRAPAGSVRGNRAKQASQLIGAVAVEFTPRAACQLGNLREQAQRHPVVALLKNEDGKAQQAELSRLVTDLVDILLAAIADKHHRVDPALAALVGGDIPIVIASNGSLAPHLKTGKVRRLLAATTQRSRSAPDVPSTADVGMTDSFPGDEGYIVRAGTPMASEKPRTVHGNSTVTSSRRGADKVVDILGAGETFGEAVMFLERPHIVDAHALQDSLLVYVDRAAMFDEIDEGTAIMKCGGPRPVGPSPFVDLSDVPTDHYLWLSGQVGRLLRGEIPATAELPKR